MDNIFPQDCMGKKFLVNYSNPALNCFSPILLGISFSHTNGKMVKRELMGKYGAISELGEKFYPLRKTIVFIANGSAGSFYFIFFSLFNKILGHV